MSPFSRPAMLDKLSDGVLILASGGRLLYANPAARIWLELGADDPLPKSLAGRFTPAAAWDALLAGAAQVELTYNNCQLVATGFSREDQTAILLQDAAGQESLRQLQERADRLAIINRLSAQFGSTLNSQEIMDTVVHEMAKVTSVDQCRLVLFDDQMGYGTIRAENIPVVDADARIIPMAGNPSYDLLLETRKSLVVEDVSTHPATVILADRYKADDVKSMLIVPMLVQERLIGSVGLNAVGQHRKFTDAEVEMCATICNQAAIALENARLYEEVQGFTAELEQRVEERTEELARETERTASLLRITSELGTSLDLERVLHRALEMVSEAIGAAEGAIYMLDPVAGELIMRAALGRDQLLPAGGLRFPYQRGEGLVGWVVQNRQSVIVGDLVTDVRGLPVADTQARQRSALAVPLSTSDGVVGVLMLFSPRPHAFTDPQLQLVEAAALQVVTAMNNAELFKLIGEQAERLGGMMRAERDEAAKSAAILESVADGVMVVDANSKVILFNATAERMFELDRSQILNEPITRFIGLWGKAGAGWVETIEEWTRSTINLDQERPFLEERLEVGQKVVSVHLAPVVSERSGFPEFLGTVSVFRDITKDVELDRMQREWVSTVSHELRTPMTSIKGYADLLMLGAVGEVTDAQKRFLEVIKNNADRLSLLVNDLLDISRIETGRLKLDFSPISVYDLVETVIDNLLGRREQEGKDIVLEAQLPRGLPELWADIDRATQILTNLMDNAFNYTPAGGRVTVTAQQHGERVELQVRDSGIGISPEDQVRIFERFYRSDHPDVQQVSGTGLGLAIVSHLVEMHGGRLRVFSEGLGKGSTFSFTLRVAQENLELDE